MTDTAFPGYNGVLLEVDLTAGKTTRIPLSPEDARLYIGGRGLGMKLLAGRLGKPGVDAMSPENPLLFMPGPFSGFPIPSASRTCVVTKSPRTSPLRSKLPKASTVSYANMGGFFGPEIRFAGYDAIVVTGRAAKPVYHPYRRRQGRGPRRLEVLGHGHGRVRSPVHRGPRRPALPDLLHRPVRREPRPLRLHPEHRGPGRRARRRRRRHGFEESQGGRRSRDRDARRRRPRKVPVRSGGP